MAALEEQLFNHPDPYDLEETYCVVPALQAKVTRSTTRFDIKDCVKLDDPRLKSLITKVDSNILGASLMVSATTQIDKPMGNPGDWSIVSFLDGQ